MKEKFVWNSKLQDFVPVRSNNVSHNRNPEFNRDCYIGGFVVHSNALDIVRDSLVELVKHHLEFLNPEKPLVIVERNREVFHDARRYLLNLMVNFEDERFEDRVDRLVAPNPGVGYLHNKETQVFDNDIREVDEDGLLRAYSRPKIDYSIAQKLLHLSAEQIKRDQEPNPKKKSNYDVLVDKKGNLSLFDINAITLVYETPQQAKKAYDQMGPSKKKQGKRLLRTFRPKDHYSSKRPYNAYHVYAEVQVPFRKCYFELHFVDEESDWNNNKNNGTGSHWNLQATKQSLEHSMAERQLVIVDVDFGMDTENYDEFMWRVIDHTPYLGKLHAGEKLVVHQLLSPHVDRWE